MRSKVASQPRRLPAHLRSTASMQQDARSGNGHRTRITAKSARGEQPAIVPVTVAPLHPWQRAAAAGILAHLLEGMKVAQINWNDLLPQENWKALTSIGACLVVLAGAGWALFSFGYTRGKDIAEDQIAAYKVTNDAKLPDIIPSFLKVSTELREGLRVFDRNKELEAENASYQRQLAASAKARADVDVTVTELREKLRTAAATEAQLRDRIATFLGNSRRFTMSANTTELLGEGHAFGVINISSSTVDVNVDNKSQELASGNYIPVEFSNKRCTLTFLNTAYVPNPPSHYEAAFDWTCKSQ
jgi:hypothetical protein